MGVREAQSKDCFAVESLYHALVPNSKNISVSGERLEQIKTDPNNYLFIYQDGEMIQGTIFLTLCLDPMYQFRPYAVIENFIVHGDARGRGIGTQLLNHVEAVCVGKNCTKIMLLSSASRAEAHEFFIKNGYNGNIRQGFQEVHTNKMIMTKKVNSSVILFEHKVLIRNKDAYNPLNEFPQRGIYMNRVSSYCKTPLD